MCGTVWEQLMTFLLTVAWLIGTAAVHLTVGVCLSVDISIFEDSGFKSEEETEYLTSKILQNNFIQ